MSDSLENNSVISPVITSVADEPDVHVVDIYDEVYDYLEEKMDEFVSDPLKQIACLQEFDENIADVLDQICEKYKIDLPDFPEADEEDEEDEIDDQHDPPRDFPLQEFKDEEKIRPSRLKREQSHEYEASDSSAYYPKEDTFSSEYYHADENRLQMLFKQYYPGRKISDLSWDEYNEMLLWSPEDWEYQSSKDNAMKASLKGKSLDLAFTLLREKKLRNLLPLCINCLKNRVTQLGHDYCYSCWSSKVI